MNTNIILDRRLGSNYPISIGTSLALETIGRPTTPEEGHTIPPMPKPIKQYGVFTVSVNTLIKNLIDSVDHHTIPKDVREIHHFIMDQIQQELMVIEEVVKAVNPNIQFHPYVNNFGIIMTLLAKLNKRRYFSGKVGARYKLYYNTLMVAITRGIKVYNSYVNMRMIQPGANVLNLTSFVIDIVGNERSISLLEPHTGVVRQHDTLYKKLYKVTKDDMSVIPFNIITHLLFGDKHMVMPDPLRLRREFLGIAHTHGFIYNTPKNTMLDAVFASEYKDLKRSINRFKNL